MIDTSQESRALQGHIGPPHHQCLPRVLGEGEQVITCDSILLGTRDVRVTRTPS